MCQARLCREVIGAFLKGLYTGGRNPVVAPRATLHDLIAVRRDPRALDHCIEARICRGDSD